MNRYSYQLAGIFCFTIAVFSHAQSEHASTARYQALQCPVPAAGATWTIHDRDGAGRQVIAYLSSLGQGEAGTGVISSPPFVIDSDQITFTIRGHDGPAGGRDENYIALVDARKGNVLKKSYPPQNDALQEQVWDVGGLRNQEVRIELHDGHAGGAFAWLGIGRIDAGDNLRVDFSAGMPEGWTQPQETNERSFEVLSDGVPFRRDNNTFTIIPDSGSVEIPCGFPSNRLFFLGCTVSQARPLESCGGIEIHYREGSPEVFPLMSGFTLDGRYKLLSPSNAIHLHGSSDPYQYYLAIRPRAGVIEKIRLVAEPGRYPIPRITAITCETAAESDNLLPLPQVSLDQAESRWIESHSLTADGFDLMEIIKEIRRAHRLPDESSEMSITFEKHQLDGAFRSEGVAVADFNGDGALDIAAGSVYYAGPDWRMVAMTDEPKAFNRFGYSDGFLCFDDDLNGDGAVDLIMVGFPGQQTYWLENPGREGVTWPRHLTVEHTGNETPHYTDVDGDGRRELIFVHDGRIALACPGDDPVQPWPIRYISQPGEPAPGHGLGVGDINNDDRLDILVPEGWWENPGSSRLNDSPWSFHPATFFGGAQLCVDDFDNDGDNDVLGSSPHGYGIAWTEQTADGWVGHEIDDTLSQTHAIHLADINRDGRMDFVTGKRFWAHNGHDPGSFQPVMLYWYEQIRRNGKVGWLRHLIDADSGVGLHFQIVDLNSDGRPDIVTSNKKGVYCFLQQTSIDGKK